MMLRVFLCFVWVLAMTSCGEENPVTTPGSAAENTNNSLTDTQAIQPAKVRDQLSFKSVSDIIDESHSSWINMKGRIASLALHFMYKDTLAVCYSPECWLMYPYKREGNKIVVLWDDRIDMKYQFDIVKAVGKIPKRYIGKPFMVLELINDTTLHAAYPLTELIQKLNKAGKERTFFPENYYLAKEGDIF